MLKTKMGIWNRLFTQEELDAVAKSYNPVFGKALAKVLSNRLDQTEPSMDELEKPNYEARRAFKDGQRYELRFILEMIGETNE